MPLIAQLESGATRTGLQAARLQNLYLKFRKKLKPGTGKGSEGEGVYGAEKIGEGL